MAGNIVAGETELEKLTRQRLSEMAVDTASRNRVVLLYQDSSYALQEYIVQKMKQLLLQKGYQVTDISFSVANPYSNCDKQLGQNVRDVCLVFGIDAVGFEMQIYNGQRWINTMACPCVSYLYHCASSFSSCLDMEELSWNIEFHAADRGTLAFIREWYQESVSIRLAPGFAFACEEQKPWQDRIYDVYVPGDYIPSQDYLQEIHAMPEVFQMIASSMISKMEQNMSMTAYVALKQVLEEINFVCDNSEFLALLESMKLAADFVRVKEMERVVAICLRHGLIVAVYGKGWEKYSGANSAYLKSIAVSNLESPDFRTHLNIMAQAKCFVDLRDAEEGVSMIHLLSAMKNGAVVFSGRQDLWKDHFMHGEGILFYQQEKAYSLESLLENYFQAKDVMIDLSEKAIAKSNEFMRLEDYLDLLLHMENASD